MTTLTQKERQRLEKEFRKLQKRRGRPLDDGQANCPVVSVGLPSQPVPEFGAKQATGKEARPAKHPPRFGSGLETQATAPTDYRAVMKLRPSSFPLEALPPPLREWVEGISRQTETAPETAALLALAASAAAIERRASVSIAPGWWEPLNLYIGLVAKPGDQSGTVLESAAYPLLVLESEEFDYYEEETAELPEDRRGPTDSNPFHAPPRRRLEELTARGLHYHLAQSPRVACMSPHGEVFRQLAGRNSASRERLVRLLEDCHRGTDLMADLPRRRYEWVERPHVTIASLVDRSTIAGIARHRECPARALLSRFLLAAPDNRVTARRVAEPLPAELDEAYLAALRRLAKHPGGSLRLEPAAQELFDQWLGEIDREMTTGLGGIAGWAKQLGGTTARLAGILHCWISDAKEISSNTLAAAIAIARWLVPQSASILEELGAADDDCSERERAVLRLARDAGEFTGRAAWQRLRKSFCRPGNLRAALRSLVERGYLRTVNEKGKRFAVIAQVARISHLAHALDECATGTPQEVGRAAS